MDLWRWQLLWQRSVFTGAERYSTGTSGSCGMSERPFLVLAPVFTAQKKWGRRMLALAVICAAALLVMTGCAPRGAGGSRFSD